MAAIETHKEKGRLYAWSVLGLGKRRIIQTISALLSNANLAGFINGTLYKGNLKSVCVPGLNCYSCPAAVGSCPLGTLQTALGGIKNKFPFYILGTLLLFSVILGRGICAFLCPFGLIQELLHKIPTPKLKKSRKTRMASWLKYIILLVFVVVMPLYYLAKNGVAVPGFCKYICPAGTLTGGIPLLLADERLRAVIGDLFLWKTAVLAAVIMFCVFIYRGFCRFLCPLGAIYSLFSRITLFGVNIDEKKCTRCAACVNLCKLDVHAVNDRECIRCGECRKVCGYGAIELGVIQTYHCPSRDPIETQP